MTERPLSPEIVKVKMTIEQLIASYEKKCSERYNDGWGRGYLTAWCQFIVGWLIVIIIRAFM